MCELCREQDIFAQHKGMAAKSPLEAKIAYLKVVSEAAYYGCEFFDVQLSNDVRNTLYPNWMRIAQQAFPGGQVASLHFRGSMPCYDAVA